MLEVANARNCYKHTKVVDLAERLPFDDDQFDLVTCVGVMTNLEPSGPCLPEFVRAIKPGGLVCFTHCTDKINEWMPQQEAMEKKGLWQKVSVSDPIPYLPNNTEYAGNGGLCSSVPSLLTLPLLHVVRRGY